MRRWRSRLQILVLIASLPGLRAEAASNFDGNWTGNGTSQSYACGLEIYVLTVRDGKISGQMTYDSIDGGVFVSDASGEIGADGRARVQLAAEAADARTSTLVGRFTPTAFSGTDQGRKCSYDVELKHTH
jgi:hypothetical protein